MKKVFVVGSVGSALLAATLAQMSAQGIDAQELNDAEFEKAFYEYAPTSFPICTPFSTSPIKNRYNRRAYRAARNNW